MEALLGMAPLEPWGRLASQVRACLGKQQREGLQTESRQQGKRRGGLSGEAPVWPGALDSGLP